MCKKYRPSNGTEGDWFISKWCMNCINEKYMHTYNDADKKCDILNRSLLYDIEDKKYPEEWQYNDEGKSICTAFVKWDWGNDGDPDDPENPKAPIPYNPNQLLLPFIFDEIGVANHELVYQTKTNETPLTTTLTGRMRFRQSEC